MTASAVRSTGGRQISSLQAWYRTERETDNGRWRLAPKLAGIRKSAEPVYVSTLTWSVESIRVSGFGWYTSVAVVPCPSIRTRVRIGPPGGVVSEYK